MSPRFRGIFAALLSVFLGSSYSIFSKYLLQWTIPETVVFFAQFFSALAVLLFFWLIPELKNIWKLDKKTLLTLACVAIFSSILSPLLYMKWLSQTSAINAIVVSKLSSIFLGIIWFFRLSERFTRKWLIGTCLMFSGILCIVMEWFSTGLVLDTWVLFVVAGAIMSAFGSAIYKKFLHEVKPEVVLLIRYILASAVFFFVIPILINVNHDIQIWFQTETWIYFAGIALIAIVASTYLRYEALDNAPASLVGAIDLLTPLSGMVLAYIFLHEWLYIYHLWWTSLLFAWLGINLIKNIHYMPTGKMKRMLMFKKRR